MKVKNGRISIIVPKNIMDPENPAHQGRFKEYAEILCEILVGGVNVFPTEPDTEVQTRWQIGTGNNWWLACRDGELTLSTRYSTDRTERLMVNAVKVFYDRVGLPIPPDEVDA